MVPGEGSGALQGWEREHKKKVTRYLTTAFVLDRTAAALLLILRGIRRRSWEEEEEGGDSHWGSWGVRGGGEVRSVAVGGGLIVRGQ